MLQGINLADACERFGLETITSLHLLAIQTETASSRRYSIRWIKLKLCIASIHERLRWKNSDALHKRIIPA